MSCNVLSVGSTMWLSRENSLFKCALSKHTWTRDFGFSCFMIWLRYPLRYIEDFNDNGQWMCARGTNCFAIRNESIKILLFVRWKLKHEYVVESFPICQPMRSRLETWFVNISRRITERSERKRSEYNVMQCSVIMSKWLMNGWRWRWGLR